MRCTSLRCVERLLYICFWCCVAFVYLHMSIAFGVFGILAESLRLREKRINYSIRKHANFHLL